MENAPSPTESDWVSPREEAARLIAAGRAADGAAHWRAMIEAGRGGILARLALADCLLAAGQNAQAVAVTRETCQLAPGLSDAAFAFGEALTANNAVPAAIAEFQRAARLDPQDPKPHAAMALLWCAVSDWDTAATHAARATALGADSTRMAALTEKIAAGRSAPRHSETFVRQLFDQFAADYDERMLSRLGYAAPQILRNLSDLIRKPGRKYRHMADLGCGSGLSGAAFRDCAETMEGVDLSPKMLDLARARGIYTSLHEADLETWLTTLEPNTFDAVVAADVFVYLGDLQAIWTGIARLLPPHGHFLFTVEKGGAADFEMGERRRFRHARPYLERLSSANGLSVTSLIEAELRFDAGHPVMGYACLLEKE